MRGLALWPRLQAHPHHAVEHEGQEADHRVRPDALWQPVVNRRDLDVGLQDPEATLDVGEGLVARNGLGRRIKQPEVWNFREAMVTHPGIPI